jgi:hypothetical protein
LPCKSFCTVRDLVNKSATFEDPDSELKESCMGAFSKSRWQLAQESIDLYSLRSF